MVRSGTARRLVIALALAAPVAVASGCAESREMVQRMGAPVGADVAERAYDRGYGVGRREGKRNGPADYTLHARDYDATTEKDYALGFRDGYSGSPNRYGEADTRDWLYGRDSDPDHSR